MVYVIQVYRKLASRMRMELQFHPDPSCKLSANRYDVFNCCMYNKILLMVDRETVQNMHSFIHK
jgi:hypothetical protein